MHARRFLLAAALIACRTSPAPAAVIEHDWHTPGDGLLTYDDVNQREWLDLTQTILRDFDSGTLGVEGAYNSIVAQTGPGDLFEGFTPASYADVAQLARSAGINTRVSDFATNEAGAARLVQLLGATIPPTTSATSQGYVADIDPTNGFRVYGIVSYSRIGQYGAGLYKSSTYSDDIFSRHIGVYLYRAAIPEPASATLLGGLGLGLLLVARSKLR